MPGYHVHSFADVCVSQRPGAYDVWSDSLMHGSFETAEATMPADDTSPSSSMPALTSSSSTSCLSMIGEMAIGENADAAMQADETSMPVVDTTIVADTALARIYIDALYASLAYL